MTAAFDPRNPFRHSHRIEGVIFDNDGTLYREPDNAPEVHTRAAVLAVKTQLSYRGIHEIEFLMGESKRQYGGSLDIFEHEYRLDMQKLRRDHYHNLVKLTNDTDYFNHADPPEAALALLKENGIGIFIATHGNEEWTEYSLEQNHISHLFSAAHNDVIHKDDVPGHPGKNQSPAMYTALMDKIGLPDSHHPSRRGRHFAMVEDTVSNLKYAKALGMMTILIDEHAKVDPEKMPAYVDIVVRDRNDVAVAVLLSNDPLRRPETLFSCANETSGNWGNLDFDRAEPA